MSYRGMGQLVPAVQPIPDPWYQQKARELQAAAAATAGLGQDAAPALPSRVEPPPAAAPKYALMVGWGAVIALTAGIFWAATRGVGTKPVSANSRRRTRRNTRRGGKRRTTRGRGSSLRRYKALSASAARRMPESSFALPGRRFPVAGPPGSSRARDKWQAMQAIRYLNMGRVGTKQEYLAVRNAVIRRYGAKFWRSYDGPSWEKVQGAKRKRSQTRRKRPARRRLAANRTSRRGAVRPNQTATQLENIKTWGREVGWETGMGLADDGFSGGESDVRKKALQRDPLAGLHRELRKVVEGSPQTRRMYMQGWNRGVVDGYRHRLERLPTRRLKRPFYQGAASEQPTRRLKRPFRNARRTSRRNPKIVGPVRGYAAANTRRTSKRRSTAKSRVGYALSSLRHSGLSPKRAGLSSRIAASLARRPGLYRVGKGKVTKYKGSTSLQGAMTSTRLAASGSGETHWLVKVYKSGRPKVVVVRKIDAKGKTVYRVEEAAQRARKRRRAVA